MTFASIALSEREFGYFQRFIHDAAGITLSPVKRMLVAGRLAKRLQHHGLDSYEAYFRLLGSDKAPGEAQIAIDLLTTNETSFFREAEHFEQLREIAATVRGRTGGLRVWSAASASGEEVYSIAMTLADCLPARNWQVLGSDISTRMLDCARHAIYPLARSAQIPPHYLKRFCLRGHGPQEGSLLIDPALRRQVNFEQINLNEDLPLARLGSFDVIFLRNVMIYFNPHTKAEVVTRLLAALRPGGHLFIGHAESLHGVIAGLHAVAPSVYRYQPA